MKFVAITVDVPTITNNIQQNHFYRILVGYVLKENISVTKIVIKSI